MGEKRLRTPALEFETTYLCKDVGYSRNLRIYVWVVHVSRNNPWSYQTLQTPR